MKNFECHWDTYEYFFIKKNKDFNKFRIKGGYLCKYCIKMYEKIQKV